MPRITRSRAIARLIAKWLDHRLHHRDNVETMPLSKLLTDEIAATAALDLCAVFDDEIEERHRRHRLLRAWMENKPQGHMH